MQATEWIDDLVVDWHEKSAPTSPATTVGTIGEAGWNVLEGDLPFPVMVLKDSAVTHNLDVMARWCLEHGVCLAPHGKTSMAPQLVHRQLSHGAWAVTAATVAQARVFAASGMTRILLANQVVDPVGLAWLAQAVEDELEVFVLVDSVAGVELLDEAVNTSRGNLKVLLEIGVDGGRCGVRSDAQADVVADAVTGAENLELAGVETFEGILHSDDTDAVITAVDALLTRVADTTHRFDEQGRFDGVDEVVVTAGGSGWFDRVVAVLGDLHLRRRHRLVIRSGGYLTHDVGRNHRVSPLDGRRSGPDRLVPALEVWSSVLSRPESELAVLGMGKRDVPFDTSLPVPQLVHRAGTQTRRIDGEATVVSLHDQHAVVRIDAAEILGVGDLVGSGIDHPCTAFDKWRLIPVVDDDYTVTAGVATFF